MNIIEVLNEQDEVIAYIDEEGVVGGEEGIIESQVIDDTSTAEIEDEPAGTVTVYYDGSSWTKIASYDDGQGYEWKDFNGAYTINRECPFNLKFKDAEGNESNVYKVMENGTFLFHEDGTWERIGE